MDLPFFIILFSNAGGEVSPAFQKILEFFLRKSSWLTFLSYLLCCLLDQHIHGSSYWWWWEGVVVDDKQLQTISFLMIKLGTLSREGRVPEIIWLIKGKPLFIFWKKGDCQIAESFIWFKSFGLKTGKLFIWRLELPQRKIRGGNGAKGLFQRLLLCNRVPQNVATGNNHLVMCMLEAKVKK